MKITRRQLRKMIIESADQDGDGKLSPDELRGLAGDLDSGGEEYRDIRNPKTGEVTTFQGYFYLDGSKLSKDAMTLGQIIDELSKSGDTRGDVLALQVLMDSGYHTIHDDDEPDNPKDIREYIKLFQDL
jgi:hypothetical protein